VINRVTNGQGVMPPFAGKLSPAQIEQVADYVSARAGA
jgi:mono/diheme cytochrome c family protein